jgi:hypothetical protein
MPRNRSNGAPSAARGKIAANLFWYLGSWLPPIRTDLLPKSAKDIARGSRNPS